MHEQNCVGLERLVVQAGVYDKFIEAITPKVKDLNQGATLRSTFDCGAMAMGPAIGTCFVVVDTCTLRCLPFKQMGH